MSDNSYVFPFDWKCVDNAGLTKREYAAIAAMQGLCADHKRFEDLTTVIEAIHGQEVGSKENAQTLRNLIAKMAIGHADALLAELERTK